MSFKQSGVLKSFLLLIILQSILMAQSWREFRDDMDYSWTVTKDLGTAITNPSGKDLTALLIGSGAVVSAYFLDDTVRNFAKTHQNSFASKIANIDNYYGNYKYMISVPILVYAGGFLSDNSDIQSTGLKLSQAVFYSGLITIIIKELAGRSRPYLNEGRHQFSPFTFNEDRRSFFSGHSSVTFALSTVMANEVDNIAWKIFWYGAAGTVAGSRIYHDKHWFSDTVAGALIGYAIGNFVSRQAKKRDKKFQMMEDAVTDMDNNDFLIQYSIPLYH